MNISSAQSCVRNSCPSCFWKNKQKRIFCKQGITLLSNVFPLCCLIRIRGIQAKQVFIVAISLAFALLNPLHLRHRHFVGHYRAFSDFARGPWSVHPTRSLRSKGHQTKWKCAGCSPTSFAFHLSRSARAFFVSLTKVMHLISAVLCFWGDRGDWHTADFQRVFEDLGLFMSSGSWVGQYSAPFWVC